MTFLCVEWDHPASISTVPLGHWLDMHRNTKAERCFHPWSLEVTKAVNKFNGPDTCPSAENTALPWEEKKFHVEE